MQMLHMISVIQGTYEPLAGGMRNTIRRYKGNYQGLTVGDDVVMHHTEDPKSQGAALVTEFLKVSSMAVAPIEELVLAHGVANHAWERAGEGEEYASAEQYSNLRDNILGHYPVEEGKPRNAQDLYIAIYF